MKKVTPLPNRVREAFEGQTYLSLAELANAFQLGYTTLWHHANKGNLPAHSKGFGKYRVHRAFTLGDAQIFWRYLQAPVIPPKPARKKRSTPIGVEKTGRPG